MKSDINQRNSNYYIVVGLTDRLLRTIKNDLKMATQKPLRAHLEVFR
ncbi:hypothetical protein EC843_103298 [Buttiauxella sp. JUb87]|nr:hypothetical protein EC843_103298 [Buttiauxella sp. JUb87]